MSGFVPILNLKNMVMLDTGVKGENEKEKTGKERQQGRKEADCGHVSEQRDRDSWRWHTASRGIPERALLPRAPA